ncbi:hypothetical protein DPMN_042086 [Dreissena polymorpha]|uniref:Uncharacterized protein n=1 Tax=Dreissena polymorpha TaxID=45954 RepID=A0A9D4HUG3_DREPO|nr:hypothetical protein DPMN_042086 [Dreissena polymorpha]
MHFRCLRSKRRPVRQEPPPFPSPILKSKDTNHTSNTYCHYDYDEDKYCSIKRSPMRLTNLSDVNSSAERKLKEAFSQGVSSFDSSASVPNGEVGYMNYMDQFAAEQKVPLLEKKKSQDSETSEEDEVIIPKSEYIAYVQAIQPQSAAREITNCTRPQKNKIKNKTVTFLPVAMVAPLPSGSEESVPEDSINEDPKLNFLEMYSKTLPSRSPDKVKRVILIPGTKDDMCLASYQALDCKNVTEEDLGKAFHIKLSDNVPSCTNEVFNNTYQSDDVKLQNSQNALDKEDPDYDENPYDNLPYINVGSLRRHNTSESNHTDLYKEIVRRNTLRKGPPMESIPETC